MRLHTVSGKIPWLITMVALATLLVAIGLGGSMRAQAHVSPLTCTDNLVSLDLLKDVGLIHTGDTVTYTVSVANKLIKNDGTGSGCDLNGALVELQLPAANGSPSGATTVFAAAASFPASGAGNITYASVPFDTSILNAGVVTLTAEARVTGILHDDGHATTPTTITKPVNAFVFERPSTDVNIASSAAQVASGGTVESPKQTTETTR